MPLARSKRFFLRQALTRQSLTEFARTMAWVAPLTVLIWVYAEREQVSRASDLQVTVVMHAPGGGGVNRVATFPRSDDRIWTVSLEGPRVRLDSVRDQMSGGLVIELDPNIPNGSVNRNTAELLNRHPLFRSGVKVLSVSPPEVMVRVDPVVTRDFVVTADPAAANFDGPPVFDPPTVKVTGPQPLIESITAVDTGGRNFIRPDFQLAAAQAALKSPGAHDIPDVTLVRPRPPNVDDTAAAQITVTPDRVRATVRIRQADGRYTIPSMPVFPLAPANLLEEYRPVFEPTIPNVTVVGPIDLINALKAGTLPKKPKAILELSRDDLTPVAPSAGGGLPAPAVLRTRRLRFDLPEGLTVSPEDQTREVEFRLEPRTLG